MLDRHERRRLGGMAYQVLTLEQLEAQDALTSAEADEGRDVGGPVQLGEGGRILSVGAYDVVVDPNGMLSGTLPVHISPDTAPRGGLTRKRGRPYTQL